MAPSAAWPDALREVHFEERRGRTGSTLARFLVVGVSNTLVSGAVFYLWRRAVPGPVGSAALAQVVAYGVGLVWAYQWNRRWTFRAGARRGVRFVTLQLALLVASALALGLLVDRLRAPALPAWVGTMAVVTGLNYAGQRLWVFPAQRSRREPAAGGRSA